MQHYVTMADRNFAIELLSMYGSMQQYCQPYRLWVITLCDRMKAKLDSLQLENITSVHITELLDVYPKLSKAQHNRERKEFIWTCTSHSIHRVLSGYNVPSLCFLDGDSLWFHEPSQLWDEIGDQRIALTPHRFSHHVMHYIVNGIFNAGFIYVKNAPTILPIIEEWMHTCIEWSKGRLTDQVHLNYWLERYGAYPVQHKGVNLAPWNQAYQYTYRTTNGTHYVDNDPITWYHFHGGLEQRSYHFDPFVWQTLYPIYRVARQQAQQIVGKL